MTKAMVTQWDRLITRTATRAFWTLQARYSRRLPFEVDDFVQAGLLAVWRLPERPAGATYSMKTYVANTVRWRCADLVRTFTGRGAKRGATTLWTVALDKPGTDNGTTLAERIADPDAEQAYAEVEAAPTYELVARVVAGLPARDQRIVRMRLAGHNNEVIARELGISPARVSQILIRLRWRLRASGL